MNRKSTKGNCAKFSFFRICVLAVLLVHAPSSMTGSDELDQKVVLKTLNISAWNDVAVLDFGDHLVKSSLAAEITIVNDTDSVYKADNIEKSCGCLHEIPESLILEKGRSVVFPVKIKAPDDFALLRLGFTLLSKSDSIPREAVKEKKLTIIGRSRKHYEVEPPEIVVQGEEIHKVELAILKSRVSSIAKTSELQVNVRSDAVKDAEFVVDGNRLKLNVDPTRVPSWLTSEVIEVDFFNNGIILETHRVILRVAGRCVVRPSALFVQADGTLVSDQATFIFTGAIPQEFNDKRIAAAIVLDGDREVDCLKIIRCKREGKIAIVSFEMKKSGPLIPHGAVLMLRDRESEWSMKIDCKTSP